MSGVGAAANHASADVCIVCAHCFAGVLMPRYRNAIRQTEMQYDNGIINKKKNNRYYMHLVCIL